MTYLKQPDTQETAELDGIDSYTADAIQGAGNDGSNPAEWPDEVRNAARRNWRGGPEEFDRWVATFS